MENIHAMTKDIYDLITPGMHEGRVFQFRHPRVAG